MQNIINSAIVNNLKSSMDRFIDNSYHNRYTIIVNLKSSMDRFIAIDLSCLLSSLPI